MTASPASHTSGEQVRRLLQLVPYLHARRGVRLHDAAKALGVTPKQLLADLKVLLMCGLPGGFPDDLIDVDLETLEVEDEDTGAVSTVNGVISVSNADYLSRPLRLTPTEASALIVALRTLRTSAATATREVVDRTLAKLESAAATGTPPVENADAPDPLADLRALLDRAVTERRQARITYYVPTRDEESDRIVDPLEVQTRGGATYLSAFCHAAEAPRLFRLDRIHDAALLDSPVTGEPDVPAEPSRFTFEAASDAEVVTLRLAPAARWVTEYYPVLDVRPQGGGVLEVDLAVSDARWLRRLLLRLAPHAEVVAPEAYAEQYASAVRTTLARYS